MTITVGGMAICITGSPMQATAVLRSLFYIGNTVENFTVRLEEIPSPETGEGAPLNWRPSADAVAGNGPEGPAPTPSRQGQGGGEDQGQGNLVAYGREKLLNSRNV